MQDAYAVCGFFEDKRLVRVPGPGYLAPGTRYRINAEDRTPSTEDRAKPAHRVCMIEMVGIPVTRHLEPDTWHRIDAEGRGPKVGHRTQSWVPGTWDLIPGTGADPTPKAGYRAPGTEPGDRGPGTWNPTPGT